MDKIDLNNLPSNRRWQADTLPYAFSIIDNIEGKRVLEIGCGNGDLSILLAEKKPEVIFAMDVFTGNIDNLIQSIKNNGLQKIIRPSIMQGEFLGFKNGYFDLVFCNMCIHHMILPIVFNESKRVLKKGGELIFIEPFGDSFIENIPRVFQSIEKWAEDDSGKLKEEDIIFLNEKFSSVSVKYFDIISRLDRVIRNQKIMKIIRILDRALLSIFPILNKFARFVVIKSVK